MLQEQLWPSLNSVAILSSRNGVACVTDDRENGTSIGDESDWRINASDSVVQIDDSGYDEVVIKVAKTESTDDNSAIDSGGPSNANPNEIEGNTISTQNTFDLNNSNNE